MEKKNKVSGGKTEHGNPLTAESRKAGKKGKKNSPADHPIALDGGGGGPKTEHGARGPKPL